jgi:hypothetical protein
MDVSAVLRDGIKVLEGLLEQLQITIGTLLELNNGFLIISGSPLPQCLKCHPRHGHCVL